MDGSVGDGTIFLNFPKPILTHLCVLHGENCQLVEGLGGSKILRIEYVYPRVKRSQVCKITMLKFSRLRRDHRQFSIVIMLVNVSLEGIYDIFAAYILRDVLQLPQGLMIPIKRLIFSR